MSGCQRKAAVVFGDGRDVRDLLFVDDAVEALVASLASADLLVGAAYDDPRAALARATVPRARICLFEIGQSTICKSDSMMTPPTGEAQKPAVEGEVSS